MHFYLNMLAPTCITAPNYVHAGTEELIMSHCILP